MVRGAGARVVGRFDHSGRVRARRGGQLHVDLPTQWITHPDVVEWPRAPPPGSVRPGGLGLDALRGRDLVADLDRLLGSRGGCSRWPLFAHYDSDVQGRTSLRPGDADAGLLVPYRDENLAVAVAVAGAARLVAGVACHAGGAAVAEAVRNVVAVGATPWALTEKLKRPAPDGCRPLFI